MSHSAPFQRLEARIKHLIAQRRSARSAEADTLREAALRRRLLGMAGFSAEDTERFAQAARPDDLPGALGAEIRRHVAFCLATQRRMARRNDPRYDLTRHLFLHRLDGWLAGRPAEAADPAAVGRLPGSLANRAPRRPGGRRRSPGLALS